MSPKLIRSFFIIFVTVFLIIDYFPDTPWISQIPGIVFFILLIIYLLLGATTKKTNITKSSLKAQLYTIGYIIVIGIVFLLSGGESQGIIIFTHGVFWFSILIALIELVRNYIFYKSNGTKTTDEKKPQ